MPGPVPAGWALIRHVRLLTAVPNPAPVARAGLAGYVKHLHCLLAVYQLRLCWIAYNSLYTVFL